MTTTTLSTSAAAATTAAIIIFASFFVTPFIQQGGYYELVLMFVTSKNIDPTARNTRFSYAVRLCNQLFQDILIIFGTVRNVLRLDSIHATITAIFMGIEETTYLSLSKNIDPTARSTRFTYAVRLCNQLFQDIMIIFGTPLASLDVGCCCCYCYAKQ
ncbi:hypothetical protein FF38_06550 [Lucilia cuprina]|uniref:Uncharacterized protein n=1 Tax=Lucilia cuprina TaxID=7375 RepID=A0A0L0C556_LUCCU|nr:hypothetical protein FF38_06550 [Lucilia cuprina]